MADSFKDFIVDQLSDLEDLECRAMFGGYGLYQDDIFFGILYKGRLYFKTDETTVASYKKLGMKVFRPNAKQTLKNYYEVPVDILEDHDQLTDWAQKAIRSQTKRGHAAG
jgi:DNA transformation protein